MLKMNPNQFNIRAIFFTKNRIIAEQIFPNSITFGQLKKYYRENFPSENTQLFNKYFLNSRELTDFDIISQNFQPEQNSNLLEIYIAIELKENEENKISLINSNEEKERVYSKIIQPKQNPFGLIVFHPQNNKIRFEEYPNNYLQNYGLNSLNTNLSYCNSDKALFVTGSEKANLPYNDFWIINHKNYAISRKKLPIDKRNHSMIYAPNWGYGSGSIFLIGGDIIQTLVYDIKKGIFYYWGNMLGFHSKPSLLLYGDYLYCFNQLNEKNTFFEKTYLGYNTKKLWEKVYPLFKGVDPKEFYNNDFAVSRTTEEYILFIGGKNAKKNLSYLIH